MKGMRAHVEGENQGQERGCRLNCLWAARKAGRVRGFLTLFGMTAQKQRQKQRAKKSKNQNQNQNQEQEQEQE
jgi:hypothetical protein